MEYKDVVIKGVENVIWKMNADRCESEWIKYVDNEVESILYFNHVCVHHVS